MVNLITEKPDIDKNLFTHTSKYQLLTNNREKAGIKHLKNSNTFIDYSQLIDVYENLEYYNPKKKRKI